MNNDDITRQGTGDDVVDHRLKARSVACPPTSRIAIFGNNDVCVVFAMSIDLLPLIGNGQIFFRLPPCGDPSVSYSAATGRCR
nr:hypothetical protein [Litoreibacter ascidiaceicola]